MPEKETRVPYKICSFDIEASSSHGDFPLPKKTYKRLAMNIVDVFNRHLSCQKLEKTQCGILCKKMVLAAFGYGRCDDIDLVYPKVSPGKERVSQIIDSIISTPISDIESTDASELLTLDTMFERMKEEAATNFKPGSCGDDALADGLAEGLAEGLDDDDIDDAMEHVVEEIEQVAPKSLHKPTKKSKLKSTSSSIIKASVSFDIIQSIADETDSSQGILLACSIISTLHPLSLIFFARVFIIFLDCSTSNKSSPPPNPTDQIYNLFGLDFFMVSRTRWT
jgi:hypothetical protein